MNSTRRKLQTLVGVAYLFHAVLPQPAAAHHSAAEYEFGKTVEVEGTLVELKWQNPHILFKVRSGAGTQAGPTIWEFEGGSLSIMRRTNATRDKLRVGDKVRVAGNPSRRAPNRMFALNLLQADGTELVFFPDIRPRWRSAAAGSVSSWFDPGTAANASAGIFRVWSSKLDDPKPFFRESYPLTEAARVKLASWDPVHSEVAQDCEPMGMPIIMDNIYPMEFVRQKDAVVLRMELYDTVRTIHMGNGATLSSLPRALVGRSTGRWEGATLVVNTDGITWPYIDHRGMPLSPAASLVERFTPSADGTLLQYSVVITDLKFLTEPVELKRSWVARPNESVKPFNCGRSSPA